ncbi:hypothetical protein [Chitinimonas koreensis]|nr:hypothetical protein [Chitinimonas koreensis]QNM94915.1 hypothetical protein H9L41_13395 [Chitinimonas koreensis]
MASVHRDPTLEAAHRLHERNKRRRSWQEILRKRRRIQRLVRAVMAGRR